MIAVRAASAYEAHILQLAPCLSTACLLEEEEEEEEEELECLG